MVIKVRALPAVALCCCLAAVSAYAQDPAPQAASPPPANLAYVEGLVDLIHDGLSERANPPTLLTDGDIVRTVSGRAEIVFADGTLLYVDRDAELEFLEPGRVRLQYGRVLMRISAAGQAYYVDAPSGTVKLDSRGEYGIATDRVRGQLEVSVARGEAEIDDGTQRVVVRGGELVSLTASGARPFFQRFNSARWDAFEQWANDRAQGFSTSRSAAQLPYELRPYGPILDQYGRWDYVADNGYVWFPSVAVGWRPYYDGWWGHTRYGWTWYGRDRWAWPTHHFGRWGFNGSLWYWIPARIWGPAWVSWGIAPGYVSWSPLGFNGQPVISLWRGRDHPAYAPYYNPWRSWTIVPRDRFGPRRAVRPNAIDGDRLDDVTRRAMIMQNGPPASLASAVPRATAARPGAIGNTRRETPGADRPGNVRSPFGPYAIRPRTTDTGETAPPRQTPPTTAPPPTRRATDAPAYAPGPAYTPPEVIRGGVRETDGDDSQRRRGGVRDPRSTYGSSPSPPERPVVRAPAEVAGEPRAPEQSGPQAGAVERGGRSGRPSGNDGSSGQDADRGGRIGGGAARGGGTRGGDGGERGGGAIGRGDGGGGRIAPAPRAGSPSEGGGARSRGGSGGVASPGGRAPSGDGGGARRRP